MVGRGREPQMSPDAMRLLCRLCQEEESALETEIKLHLTQQEQEGNDPIDLRRQCYNNRSCSYTL